MIIGLRGIFTGHSFCFYIGIMEKKMGNPVGKDLFSSGPGFADFCVQGAKSECQIVYPQYNPNPSISSIKPLISLSQNFAPTQP